MTETPASEAAQADEHVVAAVTTDDAADAVDAVQHEPASAI